MNKLKAHAQTENIEYFLTYADNNAIEYFRKQGYSENITMVPERYKGFIKEYNGSTPMQCFIYPYVDYVNIS